MEIGISDYYKHVGLIACIKNPIFISKIIKGVRIFCFYIIWK